MLEFLPRFGEDGTKTAPSGDIFDQPLCERISICNKLADSVGYHVTLPPGGDVMLASPGRNRRPPPPPPSRVERFLLWMLLFYVVVGCFVTNLKALPQHCTLPRSSLSYPSSADYFTYIG